MARRTFARVVFRIERCSVIWSIASCVLTRVRVARQRRATKSQVWHRSYVQYSDKGISAGSLLAQYIFVWYKCNSLTIKLSKEYCNAPVLNYSIWQLPLHWPNWSPIHWSITYLDLGPPVPAVTLVDELSPLSTISGNAPGFVSVTATDIHFLLIYSTCILPCPLWLAPSSTSSLWSPIHITRLAGLDVGRRSTCPMNQQASFNSRQNTLCSSGSDAKIKSHLNTS